MVMAAITYISQILNGMMMVAMIFQTLSRGMAAARRLGEVLDTDPSIVRDEPLPHCTEGQKGTVSFRGVRFAYAASSKNVLHDIDLDIAAGETLAVIGATGCGKSTLANLIPRFYDVTGGQILVNGTDVRAWELSELRERVTLCLQKSELFSTTIRDNIAIGRPGATQEEIDKGEVIRSVTVSAEPDGITDTVYLHYLLNSEKVESEILHLEGKMMSYPLLGLEDLFEADITATNAGNVNLD